MHILSAFQIVIHLAYNAPFQRQNHSNAKATEYMPFQTHSSSVLLKLVLTINPHVL